MSATGALLLFIVFEIAMLAAGILFDQSLLISIAFGLFAVVGVVVLVTSDFVFERWERWRDRVGDR